MGWRLLNSSCPSPGSLVGQWPAITGGRSILDCPLPQVPGLSGRAALALWDPAAAHVATCLVEGAAQVRRCTLEGRGLMSLDLQAAAQQLHKVLPPESKANLRQADDYIKASKGEHCRPRSWEIFCTVWVVQRAAASAGLGEEMHGHTSTATARPSARATRHQTPPSPLALWPPCAQAFYLPLQELTSWARAHPEYTAGQVLALAGCIAESSGLRKKEKAALLAQVEGDIKALGMR